VGLEVAPGQHLHSVHYADDANALLRSLAHEHVHEFLHHMHVFACASGQFMNLSKVQLMHIGVLPAAQPVPAEVNGIRVVQRATTLGITFSNEGNPCQETDWDATLEKVSSRFAKVAKLHLSIFGRAQAAAAYGISRILHVTEFSAMPAAPTVRLAGLVKKLVDRGVVPGGPQGSTPIYCLGNQPKVVLGHCHGMSTS
jgi:hypothetical protein